MCTGRIDLAFLIRAFAKGADGVFVAGCHLNACNYITHGNFYAVSMTNLCKKLIAQIGVNPERLRIELVSGSEGHRFAEIVNDFAAEIQQLGPLGKEEGEVRDGLEKLLGLVPYFKAEKKEKLEARLKNKEDYQGFYTADEIEQLLKEVPSYCIDPDKCKACMLCAKRCPADAISGGKNLVHVIGQDKCIKCGACLEACPPKFGAVSKVTGGGLPDFAAKEERAIGGVSKKAG